MQGGRGRRGQRAGRAEGDQAAVEADDEAVVAADAPGQSQRQPAQPHQFPQAVGRDGNIGDLPGQRRAAADGDAGVRLGQGRRVVDAVPHHQDTVAFPAQRGHIAGLVGRQDPGVPVVHPDLGRDGPGGAGAVPGQHDGAADAQRAQRFQHGPRLCPRGVGDAEHRGQLAAHRQVQVGIFGRQSVELFPLPFGNAAALILEDEVGAADAHLLALHRAGDAVGHQILHLGVALGMVEAAAFGLGHHGAGHRMGEVLLQTGSQPQHLGLVVPAEGHHLRHPGAGVGQGAGLVKDDGVGPGRRLEEFAALDGDMVPPGLPHGREDGQRHGQLERAGKVHHQHRQRPADIAGQRQGQQAAREGGGHQPVGKAGGAGLGGRLHLLRLLDHLDDLVVAALAGALADLHHAPPLLDDGAGVDRAAGALGHRQPLAGEGGLVDHGLALGHHAVQRDDAPGLHHHPVARLYLPDGRQYLAARRLQPDAVHVQRQALGQVGHRLFAGPVLQQLAYLQKEHHRPGGAEVPPADRQPDGQGVQQLDPDPAPPDAAQPLPQEGDHMPDHPRGPQRRRQKQAAGRLGQHLAHQFFLKCAVQRAGAVLRRVRRVRPAKAADGGQHGLPPAAVAQDDAAGPLVDGGLHGPGLGLEPGFQPVGLGQGQPPLGQPQPHPAPALMYDACLHGCSLPKRGPF